MINVEQIRRNVPIEDVVGHYVKLTKHGAHFQGLCPFHKDSRPSLQVSPHYGRWKCWACGKAGDHFDFIRELQHCGFKQAAAELSRIAKIDLDEADFQTPEWGLAEGETQQFHVWTLRQHDLIEAKREYLRQAREAVTMMLTEFPAAPKAEQFHRQLNEIYESEELLDAWQTKLETEPGSLIEPFLRALYAKPQISRQLGL